MVLDVPNLESDDEVDESGSKSDDENKSISSKKRPKGLGRLHISRLLQMVLQDAQTRLFFKAQSIIQAEIRYYVPKPGDLTYPDKLVGVSGARSLHKFRVPDAFPFFTSGPKSTLWRRLSIPGKEGERQSDFPSQVPG